MNFTGLKTCFYNFCACFCRNSRTWASRGFPIIGITNSN